MLNEPPDNSSHPHPLDVKPKPPEPSSEQQGERMILHIPVVKPYALIALVAINIGIYFIVGLMMPENIYEQFVQYGANEQIRVLVYGEYHRLVTAMFLHAS